ncbi:MAG: right-handed parallel beta-helix repeat-containing protein [Bacteroidota bacterium]
MQNKVERLTALLITLALLAGHYFAAGASPAWQPESLGKIYYVSTTGNDSNPGTASAPFKSVARGVSVLGPGDTLILQPGIYYGQPLKVSQSGTSAALIKVSGPGAILDMQGQSTSGVTLTGSYIRVYGLNVRNSRNVCVDLRGDYLIVNRLSVHECWDNGINTGGNAHIRILNSRVFRTVLMNSGRTMSSGWDSGIKVRLSRDVIIQGNRVFNNYGEGIATRGVYVVVRGNVVFNNFSANIYTNSEFATIDRNFVYCTPNSGFERNGKPAAGIALAEEYYPGWGARLRYARVLNNIVAYCKNGVRYNGPESGVIGGGLKYSTIAYNTLYGTVEAPLGIEYASAQAGNLIADNIIWQANNRLAYIENGTGLTFKHNLWKVLPPIVARGPGDRIGNPGFAAGNNPGYTADAFRLGGGSPAVGAAANINVPKDYFSMLRGPLYDMGAAQYSTP